MKLFSNFNLSNKTSYEKDSGSYVLLTPAEKARLPISLEFCKAAVTGRVVRAQLAQSVSLFCGFFEVSLADLVYRVGELLKCCF